MSVLKGPGANGWSHCDAGLRGRSWYFPAVEPIARRVCHIQTVKEAGAVRIGRAALIVR
ncbi:hypothetical protein [Kiloniella sp. b19]|uniref:hypothetical protein n=1 Tax=Kiloniella sp. GXU_MW_B19 TaxID=3141326 RepID=UPI0031D333F5